MRTHLVAALVVGVAGVGVSAAAGQYYLPTLRGAPVLASSERFVVVCGLGSVDACEGADAVARRRLLTWSAEQLDQVREWFDEMKYPETRLRTRDDRHGVYYAGGDVCGGATACNSDSPRTGFEKAFILTDEFLGQDEGTRAQTLAHELAHAGNIGGQNLIAWQDEAIAEAVGLEWDRLNGRAWSIFPPKFELDLDVPFHEGEQDGYEKGDYFHELAGRAAGGGGRLRFSYLTPLFDYRRAVSHPMSGVYGENGADGADIFAGDLRFDRVFPSWVAKFNHEAGGFLDASGARETGYYYRDINRITDAPAAAIGQPYELERPVAIAPFAAATFLLDALRVDGASKAPAEERLVVVEHRVITADRPNDVELVFEHQLAGSRRHRYLAQATDTLDTGFVRLTNAGPSPAATTAQTVRLTLALTPIRIDLPQCMESGRPTMLPVSGGSLEGVGNYRIEASAGRMDGLTFHAPPGRMTVRFNLVIESAITRSDNRLTPARRPAARVALGETEVGGDCMIRVTHNKGLVITYNRDGDYSEYQVQQNAIYYRPGGDSDVWTPGGGWADPAVARFMKPILGGASLGQILSLFGSSLPPGLDALNDPRGDAGAILGRVPMLITDTFSFRAMSSIASADGKAPTPESTPCPVRGTSGCVRLIQQLQGEPVATAFDAARRLVGLALGGHVFVIEYGTFAIRRPPGW